VKRKEMDWKECSDRRLNRMAWMMEWRNGLASLEKGEGD
jgi:hypothetical protein